MRAGDIVELWFYFAWHNARGRCITARVSEYCGKVYDEKRRVYVALKISNSNKWEYIGRSLNMFAAVCLVASRCGFH